MKILKSLSGMFFTMAVMVMFGCGGGGGGGTTPPPTTATLKLLSQSSTAGTKIRGIEVTVVLPPGVTVNASQSSVNSAIQVTDAGVIVPSGVTTAATFNLASPVGVYTPATNLTPATIAISLPGVTDFNLGEYVTVNTKIAAGSFPKATDFSLLAGSFIAVDLNGAVIPGVTSSIVADLR